MIGLNWATFTAPTELPAAKAELLLWVKCGLTEQAAITTGVPRIAADFGVRAWTVEALAGYKGWRAELAEMILKNLSG
jgi:hypothetical protein